MTSEELTQLHCDILNLTAEFRDELNRLNVHSERGDSLAVASVAYRMRNLAKENGLIAVADGAARIEASARRDNVEQFRSDIQLLDHQVRWHSQLAHQPF